MTKKNNLKSNADKLFKSNKYIIVAFFAAAITMLTIYLCNKMIPFGENTILRMDLYHQYGPLFAELYERIVNSDNMIYSWISGLGSCFLGNYFNYLSSPLGFIVLFFGHKGMTEAIATMILLKAALSAATFTYYIKGSLKSQNYATSAFGVMYAFCGYMLAYYWNVMWLDAMVLLPIVLLGIERIIDHGKMKTYVIGLALTMFSNYYMSYMLCIFSVIYFFYYFLKSYEFSSIVDRRFRKKKRLDNNRFLRSGVIFAIGSITAAGLMACVLLPVYQILQSSSATKDLFPTEFKTYFTFYDFFANHLANLTTTIRSSGDHVLPNVYCGALTLILAPLYFFTKTITKREKIATLSLLAILYCSFNINALNFIWHGFHWPNDLPYRQSFIYSFILVVIAYKTFIRLKEFKTVHFAALGGAILFFIMLVEEITSKNVTSGSVILTIVLIILYVIILSIFKDKRFQTASVAALLLICICSEAVMCDSNTVSITVKKDPYVEDYDDFQDVKNTIDAVEKNGFYRMELADLRTRMDNSWYYYNGASVFSSMASEPVSKLQDRLGMMGNTINSYTYNPQTPVYNMMFSLKYIVNNETPDIFELSPNYSKTYTHDKYTVYRNKYHLPIAYLVDSSVAEWANAEYITAWEKNTSEDPFALQGDYFNLATGGMGSPFVFIEPSYIDYSNLEPFTESTSSTVFTFDKTNDDLDAAAIFTLMPQTDGNIYFYFDVQGAESRSLTVTTPRGTVSHAVDQDCILDIGYHYKGDTVVVNLPIEASYGTLKFMAYTLDDAIMKEGYEILKNQQVLIEEFNETSIKGRVSALTDSLVYTSIPYDTNWKVYIDGERVTEDDYVAIGDALLGVRVDKGNHDIEFRYELSMLYVGALVTIITWLAIALYLLIKNLRRASKKTTKKRIRYQKIDNSFSTQVFLEEPKEKKEEAPVEIIDISSISDFSYPVREIISPPQKEIKREIFAPPAEIKTNESPSDNNE